METLIIIIINSIILILAIVKFIYNVKAFPDKLKGVATSINGSISGILA